MLYLEYVLGTHYILVVQSIKWKKKTCHIECNMFSMGIEGCQVPKLCKKYFTNCKPGNYLNSVEQDQKLIMPGESMMHVSIKPDVNLMSDLSQNVRHPQKCNQATGLDAWASRVKCPARFVSHLHDTCIYMSCL